MCTFCLSSQSLLVAVCNSFPLIHRRGEMRFTVLRRSERIWKRNLAKHNGILHQTKREDSYASVRRKSNNNIQRHKQHTSLFNKLPDVLVVEILSRLPPKPFFRCRSLCKTWLSLSSNVVHLNKHLQPTMSGFFYNKGTYDVGFVNLSCDINKVEVDGTMSALSSCHDQFHILDCCNGLFLIQASNEKSLFTYDVYVYNPATRTLFPLWSHKVQQSVASILNFDYEDFSLAFDPRMFHQFHIIRFTGGYNIKNEFLDIFSYERGKCKCQKRLVYDVRINSSSKGIFVDGRVHRLTTQDEILSIDPNNCSYQVIRPPNLENCVLIEIGQSRGVLHCMSVCNNEMFFIWVLDSYTRQDWTLKYQLSLDKMYPFSIPTSFYHFCIFPIKYLGHFAFHPEKDILFMPAGNRDFVSLDLSTGKGEKLNSLGNRRDICVRQRHWVYMACYLV